MPFKNNKKTGFFLLAISALVFGVTAYFVATGQAAGFDDPIRDCFYRLRNPGLTTLMEAVTYLGNWQSVVVVCLLLLAYDKTRLSLGVPASSVALADTLLNKGFKEIFSRTRPDDIVPLIEQGGYAFPSGHSVTSMAFYGVLIFLVQTRLEDRKLANGLSVLFLLLIATIGPSRIYLGIHFPTDVLAGWAEGIFVATLVMMILEGLRIKSAK